MYSVPAVTVRLVKEGSIRMETRPQVSMPTDVAAIMHTVCECLCEESFFALLLSTKNRINGIAKLSTGTLNASIVHPREVFRVAMLSNAASIILCHNHPSGDPTPSPEDIVLTSKLVEAGRLMDIPILDHVIIGDRQHKSLKEMGII